MAAKKKKIVVTTAKDKTKDAKNSSVKSVGSKTTRRKYSSNDAVLIFSKENYKWVLIGIALITLGMLLMIGGFNEDPNVFDEAQLYSFRRTLLAPVLILAGLVVEIYAIFK